ncbi:MAG: hypothetical protein KIG50_06500 [Lachnospiraceae bacterium]|nr:hypothetical protein [Lachnospiraceae bacterium]
MRRSKDMICDTCANYTYDEDYEYYVCEVDLDEDEMMRFLSGNNQECPYYQSGDEYLVVRHQM